MTAPRPEASPEEDSTVGELETDQTTDPIRDEVERLYEAVPSIGTKWRWYDIAYRPLNWLLKPGPRKFLPRPLRRWVVKGMNFLAAFPDFERKKARNRHDPLHNMLVPPGEQLQQGDLWLVELFPPSQYGRLERALKQNGWDRDSAFRSDGTNADQVRKAREGRGFMMSRIGHVADIGSRHPIFDGKREHLPAEFEYIELSAIQMGTSVTALVAHISLSETGQAALDKVWRSAHEPTLKFDGWHQPSVKNRFFAAIEATQSERERIHNVARRWLTERCGGYFAETTSGQPVVDLNIFDKFDPTVDSASRIAGEPFRALGMEGPSFHIYTSPQLPGATLTPGGSFGRSGTLKNCWGIVGSRTTVEKALEEAGHGDKPFSPRTVGSVFDEAAQAFILHVAVIRYTELLRAQFSLARDRARIRHGRVNAKRLRQLRSELLTTSLDLPAVAKDTAELWDEHWRRFAGIDVKAVPAPDAHGKPEPFDLIERLGTIRASSFVELLSDDETYRTVLSTAASLGASADTIKTGRLALLVAGTSLVVAVLTLLVAQTGDHTTWSQLADWVKGL